MARAEEGNRGRGKWRLAEQPPVLIVDQYDAFSSAIVNGCEQARNEPAHCKTLKGPVPQNETAAPTGIGNGGVTGKASSNSEAEIYSSESFAARFPIIATHFDPDNGMHNAIIRTILAALLYELSLVTRPAYPETQVEQRNWSSSSGGVLVPSHHLNRWRL